MHDLVDIAGLRGQEQNPSTARKRCTGTATETISSPFSVTRTTAPRTPVSAFITSG